MLSEYTRVMACTDRHKGDGVHHGMIGYVIEVYGDGNYEVEFSDPATGITIAQLVLSEQELMPAPNVGS